MLELVLEDVGVFGRGEVALLLTPVTPGAGEPVEDLSGGALRTGDLLAVLVEDRPAIGVELGDTGLAEVLRHHDVRSDLAPVGRYLRIVHLEDDRAVRIGDLGVPS